MTSWKGLGEQEVADFPDHMVRVTHARAWKTVYTSASAAPSAGLQCPVIWDGSEYIFKSEVQVATHNATSHKGSGIMASPF